MNNSSFGVPLGIKIDLVGDTICGSVMPFYNTVLFPVYRKSIVLLGAAVANIESPKDFEVNPNGKMIKPSASTTPIQIQTTNFAVTTDMRISTTPSPISVASASLKTPTTISTTIISNHDTPSPQTIPRTTVATSKLLTTSTTTPKTTTTANNDLNRDPFFGGFPTAVPPTSRTSRGKKVQLLILPLLASLKFKRFIIIY
jgi:hypothetical protein